MELKNNAKRSEKSDIYSANRSVSKKVPKQSLGPDNYDY